MGGKKKGSLANKLARMSDDERAKYLQRKADMEEEARRRKEQLIATFMKNKLKREDCFSRLNLAKINLEWHQIMRSDKCKLMKDEVEHLRKWIERVITLKNKIIQKLMQELDWQEELYGKNFSTHSDHIDRIIEFHNNNLEQVCKQYLSDRKFLLFVGKSERAAYEKRIEDDIEHLKTIIYGQEVYNLKDEKERHEEYIQKSDEILSTYRTELSQMKKQREKITCALWKEISKILRAYLQQTDVRRSHLAELQRLDSEGALGITANQELITKEEEEIEKLNLQYQSLVENHEEQMKVLKNQSKLTSERFMRLRKKFSFDVELDKKKLTELTDVSNKTIDDLKKVAVKGEQIMQLIETCKKYETEKEKTSRWTPVFDSFEEEKVASDYTELKFSFDIDQDQSISSSSEEHVQKVRPKTTGSEPRTSSKPMQWKRYKSDEIFQISTRFAKKKSALSKPQEVVAGVYLKTPDAEKSFEVLDKLEGLWWVYNKVKIECLKLKEKKKAADKENEKLKTIIRDVLEAAALGQSIPSAKSSITNTATRKRFALSAPISVYTIS